MKINIQAKTKQLPLHWLALALALAHPHTRAQRPRVFTNVFVDCCPFCNRRRQWILASGGGQEGEGAGHGVASASPCAWALS